MSKNWIMEHMLQRVDKGEDPKHILESTFSRSMGSYAKILRPTTGITSDGRSVSLKEKEVVSIVTPWGGKSGNDPMVRTEAGDIVNVSYFDIGESVSFKNGKKLFEGITDCVYLISLTKPLPQEVISFLSDGYQNYEGLDIPHKPVVDTEKDLSFYLRGSDDEFCLDMIEQLKSMSGASFKASKKASLTDWEKLYQ